MKFKRNKKAEGFLNFIFYSILSSIIFLLIYSLWFDPSFVNKTYEDTRDFVEEKIDTVNLNLLKSNNSSEENSVNNIKQDLSIQSCLNDVNKHIEIVKIKSPFDLTTKIKEYKKFDNSYDAINYLKEWKYIEEDLCYNDECHISFMKTIDFPTFFEYKKGKVIITEHSDIVIILVKSNIYISGEKIGSLDPLICIDGKLK